MLFILLSQSIYTKYSWDVLKCNGDIFWPSTPYMNESRQFLNTLEGLLVKEFRASQALYRLTRDERLALSDDNIPRLLALAEHKEGLLDNLGQLEDARRAVLQGTSLMLGIASGPVTFKDLLGVIDQSTANRLFHLHEGILVLTAQVRDMTRGNRALAASALQRVDFAPLEGFRTSDRTALPAIFAAAVAMRDALNADDSAAVSLALGDLQSALADLDTFVERNRGEEKMAQAVVEGPSTNQADNARFPHGGQPAQPGVATLAELIADLYHQETAYQAVVSGSNRALALV
jgi:flagellar biosynthesis/type III secretory pathway chaperone